MSLRTPIARARGLGSAKDGLHHWWVQRVSAVELREEEFPRNALGKVLKRQLREPYWGQTE